MSLFTIAIGILFGLAMLLLTGPLAIVLSISLTASETLRFPPAGFSLRWYISLLDSPQILRAGATSLEVATWTTVLVVLLAVPVALHLATSRSRWVAVLDSLFMSPMLLPAIALGLAMLMMLSNLGIGLSKWTLIAGHTVICAPFVLRTTVATAASLDPTLIEASRALGASTFFTLRRVVLPLVRSGILAGAFIAFMMSFDHVPVSLFLSDARTEVLPIRLWYMIFHTLDVRTAAVSGVLIVASFTLIMLMERATGLSRHLR